MTSAFGVELKQRDIFFYILFDHFVLMQLCFDACFVRTYTGYNATNPTRTLFFQFAFNSQPEKGKFVQSKCEWQ